MIKPLHTYVILMLAAFFITATPAFADDTTTTATPATASTQTAYAQDVPPSEYFVRGSTNSYDSYGNVISTQNYIQDKISGKNITNTEAMGDIAQSERDAQLIYDTAIQNGSSVEVANNEKYAILQAGSNLAVAKQNLDAGGNGGYLENLQSFLGFNGATNERLAQISEADAAYAKAKADAFAVTGDVNQYGQGAIASSSAAAYQDTANQARSGVFTGQGLGDTFVQSVLNSKNNGASYILLAPIGTFFPGGVIDIAGGGLSGYLDSLYKAGIAIATGLALLMIVIGGLQYVSTDSISGSSEGRKRINNAVIGLLLALGSYILLKQINPSLLRSDFALDATKSTGAVSQVDISLSDGKTTPRSSAVGVGSTAGAMTGGNAAPLTQDVLARLNSSTSAVDTSISHYSCKGTANPDWKSYLRYNLENAGVADLPVSDASRWFPGGIPTVDGWTNIMWNIIQPESGFDPLCVFYEKTMYKNSVGLFQLSADDPEAIAAGCNEQCLKNPLRNIEITAQIVARVVKAGKCVTCQVNGSWRGTGQYWSTMRK